ncbi:hypothetical protein LRS12_15770 [Sphingomonas sp. J344]|uniref:hypothetical protein n=1 Tax=Sphingomonas sp. J344 TaxID=2898434 RepID=UPI002151DC3A|nr:hypothetical protein [Sphingomonas sp. J344]MCR5872037.1 hypothetical protein [Sphingomonas sp. J344]
MTRIPIILLVSASLLASGCGARDFGDLPEDPKERALLCTRAGVMLIGATPSNDKERFDRVSAKGRELANANGFYSLFPGSNEDPGKALGTEAAIQSAVGSHWATTINTCFKAYGIEEEPVPELPRGSYERTVVCAAAIAYDNLGGREMDAESRIIYDPQAGYLLHKAAILAGGADKLTTANDDATTRLGQVMTAGTARAWAAECRKNDPKIDKATGALPTDDAAALTICDDVLSFAEEGGLAKGAKGSAPATRYAAAYRTVHARFSARPAPASEAIEAAIKAVAESGRLDQIGDQCIARFGN